MTSQFNFPPRRDDLDEITKNPRLIRYFEGLYQSILDMSVQVGSVDPDGVVKANSSRAYINTTTGKLWINVADDYGQISGWVLAN